MLTIDHVVPRSRGGTNDLKNLLTACSSCNGKKANIENKQCPAFLVKAPIKKPFQRLVPAFETEPKRDRNNKIIPWNVPRRSSYGCA
jgi:hypothetical protein